MNLSYKFWVNNARPFNLVLAGINLQGDAVFVLAVTFFHKAGKLEYYIANFFNHGRNSKLEFYWKLFK